MPRGGGAAALSAPRELLALHRSASTAHSTGNHELGMDRCVPQPARTFCRRAAPSCIIVGEMPKTAVVAVRAFQLVQAGVIYCGGNAGDRVAGTWRGGKGDTAV